jgi:hypothetical protein
MMDTCRFRKLDSCVSMVKSPKNRMRHNFFEPLDRAWTGRVLLEGNVSARLIVIGRIFHKNSPKVLSVEYDQMISALALDRPDQAFDLVHVPRPRHCDSSGSDALGLAARLNGNPPLGDGAWRASHVKFGVHPWTHVRWNPHHRAMMVRLHQ